MFTFGGIKVKNLPVLKSIMLDEVDDKWYFNQEEVDRFVPERSSGVVGSIGYMNYANSIGKHQSNMVYDWNKVSTTIMARDYKDPMRVICPYKKGTGKFIYKDEEYSIRNLTPIEYFRLQGVDDESFHRAEERLSNTHLFERAGRAICIPMLEDIFKKFFKGEEIENLRVFEAFSGIGSQRLALNRTGIPFESVGIMEVDRYGILSYDAIHYPNDTRDFSVGKTDEEMVKEMSDINIAYNFSTYESEMPRKHEDIVMLYNCTKRTHNYGDISKVSPSDLPDFDFFTYSFPCKNISVAGNMKGFEKGSETQSSLVWECEKIIREKRPKYLMMENVKNIIGKDNMETFQEWIELLRSYGYTSHWEVYNAMDFGVPQNRERVIMMSKLVKNV